MLPERQTQIDRYWVRIGVEEPKFDGRMPPPLLDVTPLSRPGETVFCGATGEVVQPITVKAKPHETTAARMKFDEDMF